MLVNVILFEIHIPHAQSLKEKRMVVKSLREVLRGRFHVSAAEVALQDLHQRARLAVCFVSSDAGSADATVEAVSRFVESNSEAMLTGWTRETLGFDPAVPLQIPNLGKDDFRAMFNEEDETDE